MKKADAKEVLQLQRQVESWKAEAARAQGSYDQMMRRLEKEERIKTLEEAEELRDQIAEEVASLEKELEKELDKIRKQSWYKELTSP